MRKSKFNSRQRQVEEIVDDRLWEWDPAGILLSRSEIPAEYRQISKLLANQIPAGRQLGEVSDWLANELNENWGMEISSQDSKEFIDGCMTLI